MRAALILLLLLASCEDAAVVERAPAPLCQDRMFDGSSFTVCTSKGATVELATADATGRPYRTFANLERALGAKAGGVAFAMNAGMFDEEGRAIGLLIENRKELKPINRRSGGGNFHLLPNGVFLIRTDGSAAIVETSAFEPSTDISFATQSGPMLVIDGKLHPKFEPDGRSRHVRNGVGIGPDGAALFVISGEPVSFGKFARFFRDDLKVKNALYFDGAVSSLWDPSNGRRDTHSPLGPMVVVRRVTGSMLVGDGGYTL